MKLPSMATATRLRDRDCPASADMADGFGRAPSPDPPCAYVLAKRALEMAARFAARRGDAGIGPQHLLYGVLCDARDPLGTQLSRRSRRQLALLGFAPGRPKPVRLQL